MKRWQRHDKEVRQALKDAGCVDSKGRLRQCRPILKVYMTEKGHTSLDFEKCVCKRQESSQES